MDTTELLHRLLVVALCRNMVKSSRMTWCIVHADDNIAMHFGEATAQLDDVFLQFLKWMHNEDGHSQTCQRSYLYDNRWAYHRWRSCAEHRGGNPVRLCNAKQSVICRDCEPVDLAAIRCWDIAVLPDPTAFSHPTIWKHHELCKFFRSNLLLHWWYWFNHVSSNHTKW